jgi:hypothetical protein
VQLEADIATHPHAAGWSIEEKINYLIEWTQRQDNAQLKQQMISLLISLAAAVIFWLSVEVIPDLLLHPEDARPQVIIRHVRERIQEQSLSPSDVAQLRIVSRRSVPVRATRRRHSVRVANLRAGTLIRACERRGKWRFVEWTDLESGQALEGWVLSKHLVPVRKRRWSARNEDEVRNP